MYIPEQLIKW